MLLDTLYRSWYLDTPNQMGAKEHNMANVKTVSLTFDEVNNAVAYDPVAGTFTWKVNVAKNVKAGDPAGCVKGVRVSKKTGKSSSYLYLRLNHVEVPAARVAWLLTHGVWPKGNVLFDDGDTANFKEGNLREALFEARIEDRGDVKVRRMAVDQQRHYGLMRYYDMPLVEYQERLLAQKGVCAICEKPEIAVHHGKIRVLSVDHDHETGATRDLLCSYCNSLLGQAKDSREVLLAALKYLDKHSSNVISLDPSTGSTITSSLGARLKENRQDV